MTRGPVTGEQRWQQMDDAARFGSIVQSSPDAIIAKTFEGTITDWNPAAEEIYGWTAEEMIGQNIRTVVPEDRWSEIDEIVARVRAGEMIRNLHTVRLHRDGHELHMLVTAAPLYNRFDQLVGVSVVACHSGADEVRHEISERLRTLADRAHTDPACTLDHLVDELRALAAELAP